MIKGWNWPQARKDGRVGAGQPADLSGPMTYVFDRPPPKSGKGAAEKVKIVESEMGYYEKMYLAFFDGDDDLRKRDGSIWKKVLNCEGCVFQYSLSHPIMIYLRDRIILLLWDVRTADDFVQPTSRY